MFTGGRYFFATTKFASATGKDNELGQEFFILMSKRRSRTAPYVLEENSFSILVVFKGQREQEKTQDTVFSLRTVSVCYSSKFIFTRTSSPC
jgi:hypothetical protein